MEGLDLQKNHIDFESKVVGNEIITVDKNLICKERVYIKGVGFCQVISVVGNNHVVLLPDLTTITMRIEKVF